MDADIRNQIERLHDSRTMAVVAVTGGGAQAMAWLLGVSGASRTVLEMVAPYSPSSLRKFLGREVRQAVSAKTAKEMARVAFERALLLRQDDAPVVGVGGTAAIASDRPKRGAHRCYVAVQDDQGVSVYSLQLGKGLRDRDEEDVVVSRLILRALADASLVAFDLPLGLRGQERIEVDGSGHGDPIRRLLSGTLKSVMVHPDGRMAPEQPVRGGVLPGSFNPFHEGHRQLAKLASDIIGEEVVFELSITNVDKPPLEEEELRRRLAQFAGVWKVVVTRALVFDEKAKLFPACTFVVGWDTAARLVEPRYYGGSEAQMLAALNSIRALGCGFLVAGRQGDGFFHTLAEIDVPVGFEGMFTSIPEEVFRYDVSSSELRVAGGSG